MRDEERQEMCWNRYINTVYEKQKPKANRGSRVF